MNALLTRCVTLLQPTVAQIRVHNNLPTCSSMDSLIVFYLYLVNAQMKWLLYIWQKLTVYLLSRMDVKSGHWLITVCTPSALHGNNCFRLIFKCYWRESTKSLQFFCITISIAHLIDQRKMIFWQKISQSDSSVLKTLSLIHIWRCRRRG